MFCSPIRHPTLAAPGKEQVTVRPEPHAVPLAQTLSAACVPQDLRQPRCSQLRVSHTPTRTSGQSKTPCGFPGSVSKPPGAPRSQVRVGSVLLWERAVSDVSALKKQDTLEPPVDLGEGSANTWLWFTTCDQ